MAKTEAVGMALVFPLLELDRPPTHHCREISLAEEGRELDTVSICGVTDRRLVLFPGTVCVSLSQFI